MDKDAIDSKIKEIEEMRRKMDDLRKMLKDLSSAGSNKPFDKFRNESISLNFDESIYSSSDYQKLLLNAASPSTEDSMNADSRGQRTSRDSNSFGKVKFENDLNNSMETGKQQSVEAKDSDRPKGPRESLSFLNHATKKNLRISRKSEVHSIATTEIPEVSQENESGIANENTFNPIKVLKLPTAKNEAFLNHTASYISWHKTNPDLMLAVYLVNSEHALKSGIVNPPTSELQSKVIIWNMKNKQVAASTLICDDKILIAKFHPNDVNLVFAASYSGQIYVWELNTENEKNPIRQTSLGEGSNYPVYSMNFIGDSPSSLKLVALNVHGRLCIWECCNVMQPPKVIDICWNDRAIYSTCMGFPSSHSSIGDSTCIVGTEDKSLFAVNLNGEISNVKSRERNNHAGPILSIDFHPSSMSSNLLFQPISGVAAPSTLIKKLINEDPSGLFLTAATDWTVKLWSMKYRDICLLTFKGHFDLIVCAKWCPKDKGIFASLDCSGMLYIWDLLKDNQSPISIQKIAGSVCSMDWSIDGKYIAVGDASGSITLIDA